VIGLHDVEGLFYLVVLDHVQIEHNHLRRSIDSCRAMDIHSQSFLQQLAQYLQSAFSPNYKIMVVHILNRILPELDSFLLAKEFEVVS
jgi:hypothetical protein